MRRCLILALAASCSTSPNGNTGDPLVDACLHWTACITQPRRPISFAACHEHVTSARRLPLPSGDSAPVGNAQLSCLQGAGLDCAKTLDCVSAPAPCPSPTWTCAGATLTRCDSSRVFTEDCGALACVPVGDEARCGLDTGAPGTFRGACMGTHLIACQAVYDSNNVELGGVQVIDDDCGAHNADCVLDINGLASCAGRGPPCTLMSAPTLRCDGEALVTCDVSGHEERTDCAAAGTNCISLPPNPGGYGFACADQPLFFTCDTDNLGTCQGTSLQYCNALGNQRLDCTSLGYRGCLDGYCTP